VDGSPHYQFLRQRQPLDAGDVKELLTQIDRTTPAGARDDALLAVALQTARRLSEFAARRW